MAEISIGEREHAMQHEDQTGFSREKQHDMTHV